MKEPEFHIDVINGGLIDPSDERISRILGWDNYDLYRQPLNFLFPADAHGRVDRLFGSRKKLSGVVFPRVPLRYKPGGFINFDMTVTEESAELLRLDFFRPGKGQVEKTTDSAATDMYSFFNFVEDILESPYDGDLDVTMVQVEGLKAGSGLNQEEKEAVRAEVEHKLSKVAIGGQLGQLDEASYGLLTGGDFEESKFEKELQVAAERLDISPQALGLKSKVLEIDDRTIKGDDLKKALSHSKSAFLGEIENDELGSTLSSVVSGVEHNCKLIRNALDDFQFRCSQRNITDAVSGARHAILNQGKVQIDNQFRLPDEIIVLVDHPNIAFEHDLAQIDEVLRLHKFGEKEEGQPPIFYELCRASLLHPRMEEMLQDLHLKHKVKTTELGLRVRGLPPLKRGGPHWDMVRTLRAKGHPMWLDRFGDAVIDESLSGLLRGGIVEMPPELMKKLAAHFDGRDLMGQLVTVWKNKNVVVVSADLIDMKLKVIASEIGIRYQLDEAAGAG